MQIELEETIQKTIDIITPYYSKQDGGTWFKFDEGGVLTIFDYGIYYVTMFGTIADNYKNSTPCTREEVESKFEEVDARLKKSLKSI